MVSTIVRWWTWTGRRIASWLTTSARTGFVPAVTSALMLVGWQQAIRSTGVSHVVQGALGAAAVLGLLLGQAGVVRLLLARMSPAHREVAGWGFLAAWGLAGPWQSALWCAILEGPGLLSPELPLRNGLMVLAAAVPLLTVPFAIACSLMLGTLTRERPSITSAVALGSAAGVASALGGCLLLGMDLFAVSLGIAALAIAVRIALVGVDNVPGFIRHKTSDEHPLADACETILAGGLGGLLIVDLRVVQQLSVASVPAQWSMLVPVLVGVAIGLAWSARPALIATRSRPYLWGASLAVAGSLSLLGLFSTWVQLSLWLNAYISSPELLWMGRAGLTMLALTPCGLALGICFSTQTGERDARTLQMTLAVAVGAAMMTWCRPGVWRAGLDLSDPTASLGLSLTACCLSLCGLILASALVRALSLTEPGSLRSRLMQLVAEAQQTRLRRLAVAALATVLIVAPLCCGQFDSARSARMLFTTGAFVAYRSGIESQLLPHMDSGRLIGSCETDRGTLTVWKQAGAQVHLREDGVPVGVISVDADVTPQFSPEVLQVVFPLMLHHQPESLLMLGLGGGAGMSAGLEFPLKRFAFAEGDPHLIRAVSRLAPTHGPLADERLAVWPVDPTLALAGSREQFDVIVSAPGHPSSSAAQSSFAPEFYRRAAARLSADGLFCQRLQAVDLGVEPVKLLLQSARPAFAEVMFIEVAHSEFLLLGTNSPLGLVRDKLLVRAQADQVGRVVAEVGLDWSILLDFPAWKDDALQTFTSSRDGASRWLPASPSGLPLTLPRDVMRWGPKQDELHTALAPHMGRLLNWMGEDAGNKELLRRLGEVTGQHRLKTSLADQYWAYRSTLREQVSKNSVTMIRQVNGGTDLAEEDRRRINYFKALSRAVKSGEPNDVRRLTEYASPYDPLLTDFVHFEAAELYAKAEPRNTAMELRHRLHTVFYAAPLDVTVRSVTSALKLLNEHPEAEPSPRQRWDLCNALLESLQTRWDTRRGQTPTSLKTTLTDIDATLVVADQTLSKMDLLTVEAGLPSDQWKLRRRVFEKHLLAPIQAYRREIQKYVRETKVVPDEPTPATPSE